MFNIGPLEFLVIGIIALVVLGPERMPGAARQIGKTMGDLRKLSSGFQNEMKTAFEDADKSDAPTSRRQLTAAPATATTDAVAAVSQQPSVAPASPPASRASAKKAAATKSAAAKKAPAKKTAAKAAPKKEAPKKAAARKTTGKAVPKAASRRSTS